MAGADSTRMCRNSVAQTPGRCFPAASPSSPASATGPLPEVSSGSVVSSGTGDIRAEPRRCQVVSEALAAGAEGQGCVRCMCS